MPTTTFIVERFNRPAWEFEGELLADVSSYDSSDKRFWQEIRIYATTTGWYVTEVIRNTSIDGEPIIRNVHRYQRPEEVRKGLFRKHDGRQFLTDLAADALEEAAKKVPAIATIDPDIITERI